MDMLRNSLLSLTVTLGSISDGCAKDHRPSWWFDMEFYDARQRGELDKYMSDDAFGMGAGLGTFLNRQDFRVGPEFIWNSSFYPANNLIVTDLLFGARAAYCGKNVRPYVDGGLAVIFHNRSDFKGGGGGGDGGGCGGYYCYKAAGSEVHDKFSLLNSLGIPQDTAGENALGFYAGMGIDFNLSNDVSIGPFFRYVRGEISDSHSSDEYNSDEWLIGLSLTFF